MSWVGRISAWLVILGVGALVLIAVLIPRIAGGTPYVVLTGSMRPTMPPGTLVVVRPVKAADIDIGSVITYQLRSGRPEVVTHRVVAVGVNASEGHRIFRTQGDANNAPDARWVRSVQIRGERWYAVPYLGYATTFISGEQRHLALVAIVTILFGYAAVMFVGAYRDRRTASAGLRRGGA
jgi:signal peptidase